MRSSKGLISVLISYLTQKTTHVQIYELHVRRRKRPHHVLFKNNTSLIIIGTTTLQHGLFSSLHHTFNLLKHASLIFILFYRISISLFFSLSLKHNSRDSLKLSITLWITKKCLRHGWWIVTWEWIWFWYYKTRFLEK